MKWYYYLHTNGDIIGKPPLVVDSDPTYFNSPFVKKVFEVDTTDRGSMIRMLKECKDLDADPRRIRELEVHHNVTAKDYECLRRIESGEDYSKVVKEIFG